jgi:hypothetical protein
LPARTYPAYNGVLDALAARLATIAGLTVLLKKPFQPSVLPAAIINPMEGVISRDDLGPQQLAIVTVEVLVIRAIVEPRSNTDWLDPVMSTMGDVSDAMLNDPTLGGVVQDLQVTGYTPGRVGVATKLYWGGVVTCIIRFNF